MVGCKEPNIAQNWSGAYGSEPCKIWAPKLPKLVFYTSWLDEPAEPAEPDANWSNRWKKILKIWKNVPSRVRNPLKKMVRDSKFGRGRYNQNNYQKTMFYTNWLDEPVELDANRFQKILKIWQNVPGRVRNPWKKWCIIPSSEKGDMIKTSLSAPNLNMPL